MRERLDKEKSEKGLVEAEEKTLSDRYDALNTEIMRLRNDIEGQKGVKRGKEEVFKQMNSHGESRQASPFPSNSSSTSSGPRKTTSR